MSSENIIILIILGIAIFIWLPAIVISVSRALQDQKANNKKQ